MGEKKEEQLKELGSKLENPPSSKDCLLELLEQAATCLSELDQLPPANILESMHPLLSAFVKAELLEHRDRDVILLVASCICEILRITAPEAPYSDDVLKDIFQLIVGTFSGLSDTGSPSFARRVVILETLAKYRSCVVMLDLECDELVNKMFSTFLSVASDNHAESVLSSMLTIMVVLLEESEDVRKNLLLVLLSVLGCNETGVSESARKLSMDVIKQCAGKLEPGIKQFFMESMSGDGHSVSGPIDYHDVLYNIYCCAPQILAGVVPYIMEELLADQLDTRLKAVSLVGGIFSLSGCPTPEAFQPIFSEFLKMLADRVVAVRMSVLEHVKSCLLSDPSRPEASSIISALCERLLDCDENVRKQVVAVIGDVACHSPSSVPVETVKLIADRLQDKSVSIKKYTMERLADIYRSYLRKPTDSSLKEEFDWIPGKILRCFYDKDFRSDTIEYVLCRSLFPSEFSVKDQVKSWVKVLAVIDKVEVKALEKILEQMQRLQVEMQRYISLRQVNQEGDVPEIQKKILLCFRIMSRAFADPSKAEENFQLLDHLKNDDIWKALTNLVDHSTSFHQACGFRDDLLNVLDEKHQLYEFLSTLSLKCSYILFNKDHVKEILVELALQKSTGNTEYILSCMKALVTLARFSPVLLNGYEELVNFLKDDDEVIKEGVLNVLALAGGTIRDQLADLSSSVDLILERLCLEGNRRQAKYAVHALAAITKDDGLKSLSVLYKRLVDMLEEKVHLPAVLQSLGCIAQTAMPVFETRESKIKEFINSNILSSGSNVDKDMKASWDDRSELSLLKIYGIKTLVKSYLPVRDAHLRPDIDGLIEMLRNILSFGEISKNIESSSVDKAHLKLASAKAILRLSRLWDHKIPVDVFYLTLKTVEIGFPEAKKLFLSKVHQYIKDHLLDPKYACAFIFSLQQSKHPEFDEEKQNLVDIIQMLHQAKARQHPVQSDATSMVYPEYILPHLVHAIAHHFCPDIDDCKDVKAYEPVYRQLHLSLSLLVHKDEDKKSDSISNKDSIATMVSIFQSIKSSADVVDEKKSKNSHALCDIGLSVLKRLTKADNKLQGLTEPVNIPLALYRLYDEKEGENSPVSKGHHTWLADESTLSHFESLKLEADDIVPSGIKGSEVIEDNEKDGNEVPLGKMIKHLKSQGTKTKKVKKSKLELTEEKKSENDIDILKMVRDINLDNLGMSTKNESSNGHDEFPSKRSKVDTEDHKNKRRYASETIPVSIPKRRRSLSARSASRSLTKASIWHKPQINAKSKNEMPLERAIVESTKSAHEGEGSDHTDEEKEDVSIDIKGRNMLKTKEKSDPSSKVKSPSKSAKKRKRRSVAGLAKCTTKGSESHDEDLVGCRIKVWWPLDKQFYEGTVKSYDPLKQKHVVWYDDGEVEVLRMEKERWELIDEGRKPTKQSKPTKASTSERSVEKKGKGSAGSNKGKRIKSEVESMRKPQKRGLKGALKGKKREAKETLGSNLSERELDEADEVNSGESSMDSEAKNKLKLVSKGKQLKEKKNFESQARQSDDNKELDSDEDMKSAPQDAEDTEEEEKPVDESEEASEEEPSKEENSDSEEAKESDNAHDLKRRKKLCMKSSAPSSVTDPEIFDDEPLVTLKSRVGKSNAKRAR